VEEVLLFKKFFSDCRYMPSLQRQPDKVVRWCRDGDFWRIFASCISASRVQYISDLHSKFALKPHYVWSMVDVLFATAEIRRGKKKKKKEEETGQNYNVRICYAGRT